MDILICTTAFEHAVTGAGGVARAISESMDNKGNSSVHILSEDCKSSPGRYHCQLNRWSKIPVLTYYFKSRSYWTSLRQLLRHQHFDVIIFHDTWLSFGARRFLRDNERQTVVVAFMHDDNTMDMPFGLSLNSTSVSHFMRWLLERSVMGKLDAVITNSDYMKARISGKYDMHTIARLYYTAHDYSAMAFCWKERNPVLPVRVLFVKNDFMRGGLKELLTALRMIPDYKFILTIVGPTRQQIVRKLKYEVQNTSQLTVDFRGPVTSPIVMTRLYHQHDVLCVPSRKEALGLANAEALASGTPVVTTTAGGICEVTNGDANGFLCPPGDIAALARQIENCIQNPGEAERRTRAGREFVLGHFGMSEMIQNLKIILSEAIQRRQGASHDMNPAEKSYQRL